MNDTVVSGHKLAYACVIVDFRSDLWDGMTGRMPKTQTELHRGLSDATEPVAVAVVVTVAPGWDANNAARATPIKGTKFTAFMSRGCSCEQPNRLDNDNLRTSGV